MRLRYRQTIRIACLATLTVIVLVACSSGPGIAAPTVGEGAPGSVDFDSGQETETLALSEVFTGENLTFSDPKSSKPAVATASIANGTLTITAVSPGEATITVTATNAGGNVSHPLAVTVPATSGPAAPTVRAGASASVEFAQGQTTRTVSLNSVFAGESLTFSAPRSSRPAVATARIANRILTITAVSPGEATITVTATNAGGNVSHPLAVTVPATSGPAAPTVRAGAPASVEFAQGQTTRTVSLNSVFAGESLTFSAPRSSRPAVATARIANRILTITAVSPGEATITVTATNAGGNVSHPLAVTVPATSGPAAPTVRAGAPASVDIDQGDTETVTLSRVFTGEDLEFTRSSSDTAVATASIANGILSIRAVSPGAATITVTATNDDGNATHRIAVTVPAPVTTTPTTNNPSDCPSPLTIERNRIAKCKLPAKATLKSPPGGGVTVDRSADATEPDVWVIRASKKGTYTVTIFSGTATPTKIGEITVVVPNSPPTRNITPDPEDKISLTRASGFYTAAGLNLRLYFDDADHTGTDMEPLRYSVGKKA